MKTIDGEMYTSLHIYTKIIISAEQCYISKVQYLSSCSGYTKILKGKKKNRTVVQSDLNNLHCEDKYINRGL